MQQRQLLGLVFLRRVALENIRDHAIRNLVEVRLERLRHPVELREQDLLEERLRCANHERRPPLPLVPVRLQPVALRQRLKQPTIPPVEPSDLEFDRRLRL